VSGSCGIYSNTTIVGSYTADSGNPSYPFWYSGNSVSGACQENYLFGFNNSNSGNWLSFTTGGMTNHYKINVNFVGLFIGTWISTGTLRIDDSSGNTHYTWGYNNYGMVGQQKCGDNNYDYAIPL
jgi:hypothetical protein